MIRFWAILAVVVLGSPALALSCLRPDVAQSFLNVQDADETYVIVHGILSFDQNLIPERDLSDPDVQDTRLPARFEGTALSKSGFDTVFKRNITVTLQCFGPWCGGAASDAEYLAFVEKNGADYVMRIDPCGSFVFPEPTLKQIKQAEQCMAGRACTPAEY